MALTDRGQLGAEVIPATGVLTPVYTVGLSKVADVNLYIANSADTDTEIKIVHIKNGLVASIQDKDYLIGGASAGLPTSSFSHNMAPFSFNAIEMTAGDTLAVSSSASALSAQANGLEEDV